ncbi:MAG: type IV pilus modification PilV family protein [Luteolibacter sp.]
MTAIPATQRGSSLIETVIAMGVLAVAIPLVFGALAESGKSGMSSEVETRSTWMVPVCMDEIRASREGRPQYFTPTLAAQAFPPNGDVWALAFSAEGKPVGKISKAAYDKGIQEHDGQAVRYIASLSAAENLAEAAPMLRTRISVEYPSASPAAKRRKIDFYTRIP